MQATAFDKTRKFIKLGTLNLRQMIQARDATAKADFHRE